MATSVSVRKHGRLTVRIDRDGHALVVRVLGDLDIRWLDDLDPAAFKNINTPDDYQDFLDALPKPIIGP